MKKSATFPVIGVLFLLLGSAAYSGVTDGAVAFRAGAWTVYRSQDPMTDATDCTAIPNGSPAIQLTPATLFVRQGGGIETVTVRFGDAPPEPLRYASRREKTIRAVEIAGADLDRAIAAGRLRVQIGIVLSPGIAIRDIDLADAAAVLNNRVFGLSGGNSHDAVSSGFGLTGGKGRS